MESTSRKLSTPQRMQVFALMARGDTYGQINNFLSKQYGLTLAVSSLSLMKSKHAETIDAMKASIVESSLDDIERLQKKSRRLLNRKLDRAERDMTELEQLDEDYRQNKIKSADYKRKKATLLDLSVNELAHVSKTIHDQTKKDLPPDTPPTPVGTNTEALLSAIKSGDTVELQRIILNPQITPPA